MQSEKLLQFIWQYKLFDVAACNKTIDGEDFQILNVGILNTNQGPDFSNAKLKIGNTIWAGDVELHINASDWYKHGHQNDDAYKKIIAHVVFNADVAIKDANNNTVPTVALKQCIDHNLLHHFEQLMTSTLQLPCANMMANVREITVQQQQEKVLIERLMRKANDIQKLLLETNNDWNEVFYIIVARAFGGGVNNEAFEALAARLPLRMLAKQKYNITQIEAMLFGVAGLLPQQSSDNYIHALITEFNFLKAKYSLQIMDTTRWKFLRMRPQNFPTIRMAQLAQLIVKSSQLLSKILDAGTDVKKQSALLNTSASEYWHTHFTFDNATPNATEKKLGNSQINNIIINAIAPTLFVYGKQNGKQQLCDEAIVLLQNLSPEKNKYTELFKATFFVNKSAADSQALLQQYQNYCAPKNCLACSIGFSILKKKG
jgi:Protein of unknown function (DUF2851)